MKTTKLGLSDLPVSIVGIGGHYKAMEEGLFEERYARIDENEVEERVKLIEKAFNSGINYFDTTWRNEVVMLDKVIRRLGIRDSVFVNGMVLGAFTGAKHFNVEVEDYFNKWLDDRLRLFAGKRFDSLMINAIEEEFNEESCERLLCLLEKRKAAGDLGMIGFSCHNPVFARKIADMYSEFKIIMVPYNFRNRVFEHAFEDYKGDADFIAMKPLVWAEYGIPFCALNKLRNFQDIFSVQPDQQIATKAFNFILKNPKIKTLVCGVNSMQELEELLAAGVSDSQVDELEILEKYNSLQMFEDGISLYVSGLLQNNLRMNYFAIRNIYRVLGQEIPDIPLNEQNSTELIRNHAISIVEIFREKGFVKYSEELSYFLNSNCN